MNRKKEIIIIIIIIITSIFLAFLPKIINNTKEEKKIENVDNNIEIIVTGEINTDSLVLEVPKGISYGYIINKIKLYLNDYSIIEKNFNQRYYENSTIVIESSDIQNDIENNVGRININTASYQELIGLYGIGEKRANKIIEYREKQKIISFEELKKIIGVSDAVIQAIKQQAFL